MLILIESNNGHKAYNHGCLLDTLWGFRAHMSRLPPTMPKSIALDYNVT
jgi:hypothetical protein